MSRNFVAAVGCVASCLIACSSNEGAESDFGQVSLQITTAPSDVKCLVLQATSGGRTVTRSVDVTPGQVITAPISGLPTGSVALGAAAYPTACAAVTTSSIPNWVSDPVTQVITLSRGTSVPLNLVLRPSSTVAPTIDWQDDGAAGSGGATSTGGAPTTGGTTSIGGAPTTGGTASTGGTTASGGTTSYACGLPVAGTTGIPKPSGTPGNLSVLNWAANKGAVTYTFDDGNSSQISNFAALDALNVRMTFYLVTGWAGASNAIWSQAVARGHELGNHTQSHASAATAADIDAATTFIQARFGVKAWTMAAPNGDASYASLARTRFLINRGVSNALIMPNDSTDAFNLPVYIPPAGASASVLNSQIDTAQSSGGWRVVLVHGFTGGSDGAYQPIALSEFTSSVSHAIGLGNMWIDSMVNVGAYWRAQKVLSTVTPTTSGSDQTWTWALPANFPPGKCLRVTVGGGTVKQAGKALTWDTHGYYEISLDAGAVTVSP